MKPYPVFLEIGTKRIYAGGVDWPGWYGHGRDEQSALRSLLTYAPRYEQAIRSVHLGFTPPTQIDRLTVLERLPGNATTDFGAPDVPPLADAQPLDEQTLHQFTALFDASWQTLQMTYQAAIGKDLRKGPRGGGRELTAIIGHVLDAHTSYLRRIQWKAQRDSSDTLDAALVRMAQETKRALSAVLTHGLPERGPRGGAIWPPRAFARRAAWHILDHIWEIEERQIERD
jgi:hypothetical protein